MAPCAQGPPQAGVHTCTQVAAQAWATSSLTISLFLAAWIHLENRHHDSLFNSHCIRSAINSIRDILNKRKPRQARQGRNPAQGPSVVGEKLGFESHTPHAGGCFTPCQGEARSEGREKRRCSRKARAQTTAPVCPPADGA